MSAGFEGDIPRIFEDKIIVLFMYFSGEKYYVSEYDVLLFAILTADCIKQ